MIYGSLIYCFAFGLFFSLWGKNTRSRLVGITGLVLGAMTLWALS